MLHRYMTSSEAWRDLDCVARCVYIELSNRYGGPGSNNGRIPCSLRELVEALHVSKATAMRALDRLQDHGFVVREKRGHFDFKLRHANEWRLTEFGNDLTGELPTKDFARWKKQNSVSPENQHGFTREPERVSTRNKGVARSGGNAS
jgi:DNA-binding transcriptional MocR family regulator